MVTEMNDESANEALLRPVRSGNVFEETVNRLLQLVWLGVYEPGDALPPERELASKLGVGRDTVRQAIKSLSRNTSPPSADGTEGRFSQTRCRGATRRCRDVCGRQRTLLTCSACVKSSRLGPSGWLRGEP